MARVSSVKERIPAAEQQPERKVSRSAEFISIYANDIEVQTSPWDMRIVFGEVTDTKPSEEGPTVMDVTQLCLLRMSPQLAKRLAAIMQEQIQAYELQFGEIPSVITGKPAREPVN